MARVLLAWGLGYGLGHVSHLMPLAHALAARGHEVSFALRDVVTGWPVMRDSPYRVLAAPVPFDRPWLNGGRPFRARSFTDILAWNGFDAVEQLEPQARCWRELIDMVGADLVVAEHAPALCVATEGWRPLLNLGTGFTVPVVGPGGFPVFSDAPALLPVDNVRACIAGTLSRLGAPCPAEPLAAAVGPHSWVTTFAEIDPYRRLRAVPAQGPLRALPPPAPLPATPRCMVYLPTEHPGLERLLQGMANLGLPGDIYIRGGTGRTLELAAGTGLAVSTEPLDLTQVLPRCSVVLHHGGAGMTQDCLAWGRPQVLAPPFVEQRLTAEALQSLGVAVVLGGPVDPANAGRALNFLAGHRESADKAAAIAASLHARHPPGALARLVARCESLLSGQPASA